MTKFSSREDRTYQNILAELKRMIKLVKERRGDDTDPEVQKGSVTHIGNNNRGALANYGSQSIGEGVGPHTMAVEVAGGLRDVVLWRFLGRCLRICIFTYISNITLSSRHKQH
jgi:hypothetical protein